MRLISVGGERRYDLIILAVAIAGSIGGANLGCSRPSPTSMPTNGQLHGLVGDQVARPGEIRVTDLNGKPVAGARILIGSRLAEPFAGNVVTTDRNGRAQAPASWTNSQPLTVDAAGYVRATYFGRMPGEAIHLKIKPRPVADSSIELRGETEGYGEIRNDGFLDLGFVLPTMSRGQLPAIHVTDVFAREIDTLSVLGNQQSIPSNLAVPTQTKTYIFPIRFSKPVYRQFFAAPGSYRVEAVHARVNISEMVAELKRGVSILELINKFDFTEGALKTVTVARGVTPGNLPVNGFRIAKSAEFTAPKFDDSLDLFAIIMPRSESDYYVSDIKKVRPGERIKISAPATNHGVILNLMRPRPANGDEVLRGARAATMSLALSQSTHGPSVSFLDIVPAPVRASKTRLKLTPPRPFAGLTGSMTYVLLSRVEPIGTGNYKLEKTSPEWELYLNEWSSNVDLPEPPSGLSRQEPGQENGQMRWEASFVGQPTGSEKPVAPGPEGFEKATHVTRSAIDF